MTKTRTFQEVQKQIEQLQKEADRLRQQEADGVLQRIREAISVYGFTAEDLGLSPRAARRGPRRASPARPSTKGGIKYKDGQGNTWGGRGPRPAWFKTALDSGKTVEDLLA